MGDRGNLVRPRTRSLGGSTGLLPSDLLELSVRRLGLLCVVVAVVSGVVAVTLLTVGASFGGARAGTSRPTVVIAAACAVSIAMALLARAEGLPVQRRLNIGVAWFLSISFGVSVFRHWIPYVNDDVLRGPSPVTIFIVLFAVLVPMRPRRMLGTALGAALTDPAGLAVTVALGNPWPRPWLVVFLVAPGIIAIAIAYGTSRVIYSLGASVTRARELGSYRLVERLGEGGMGEVWLAHHRMLARPAAVKLVKPEALGARDLDAATTMLKRFEREAQATAALNSHHTIVLYDFGIAADGTFYYVMELLDGMSLDDLVDRAGPLPPERVAFLLLQVCHSLHDAHHAGVIHRDIKPANIFVCRKGPERDYVKVLDFGLVRYHAEEQARSTRLTADDTITGTPAYMAPECAAGEEVDLRADIYALGCVAYFMLTGEDVFRGKSAMRIILAHMQDTPVAIEARRGEAIPDELEQLVMSCLAKKPEDRPQSIEDIAAAIERSGLATTWTRDRADEWWRDVASNAPAAPRRGSATKLVFAETMADAAGDAAAASTADTVVLDKPVRG